MTSFGGSGAAQEVPFDLESDAEDGSELLFPTASGPDVAIESKQRLEDLQGAFRGVSDLHRRMLVLRELEGLSYGEIGKRLGMSRPVVESTLFRARRRLAEEYEELISGRRCERTRAVIDAWEGRKLRRLGVRETRQLSRHLSHCRPCRRHAVLARGAGAVAHPPAAVVQNRAGVAHPEPVAAVVKQSAGAIVRRAAGALVLRKSAGDLPARPVERPITLASRRRPPAEERGGRRTGTGFARSGVNRRRRAWSGGVTSPDRWPPAADRRRPRPGPGIRLACGILETLRGVAQPGSAHRSGRRGPRFKSGRPDKAL